MKREILQDLAFGYGVAEDETELSNYFVETDQWRRVYSGDVDIIYGPKGSGKSAMYSLLNSRETDLFDRGILIASAENPRGQPAFEDLKLDPPASEQEFIKFWKLYFLAIIGDVFAEYELSNVDALFVIERLRSAGLLKKPKNLQNLLMGVIKYVRNLFEWDSVEVGVGVDSATGLPNRIT